MNYTIQIKGLIDIQNVDDKWLFKWCLVRYLCSANHNLARIREVDKDFARELDFKDKIFPIKITDIYRMEKKELNQD